MHRGVAGQTAPQLRHGWIAGTSFRAQRSASTDGAEQFAAYTVDYTGDGALAEALPRYLDQLLHGAEFTRRIHNAAVVAPRNLGHIDIAL